MCAESFLEMAPTKKRTRARWAGSFGSGPESRCKSAASSSNTSDSATPAILLYFRILGMMGDGFSGSDLGGPCTRAG